MPLPAARAAGPPRSRFQYQRANAMMLDSQMAPPLASNTLAFCVKLDTLMMPTTRRMAASALAIEMSPINTLVRLCSQGRSRSIRPGSPMMRTARSTDDEDQEEPCGVAIAHSCGSAARSRPVARTAIAMGQRGSPRRPPLLLRRFRGSDITGRTPPGRRVRRRAPWRPRTTRRSRRRPVSTEQGGDGHREGEGAERVALEGVEVGAGQREDDDAQGEGAVGHGQAPERHDEQHTATPIHGTCSPSPMWCPWARLASEW